MSKPKVNYYNTVNELKRVDALVYKTDIEHFRNRNIISHIHELCGSMQSKKEEQLKLYITTPENDDNGMFGISNNGKPWSNSDERRLNQFGHKKIDKLDLSPVSENGGGTKLTMASTSKIASHQLIKILKDGNVEKIKSYVNDKYHDFTHLLYMRDDGKWCHFICLSDPNYHLLKYTFLEDDICCKALNDIKENIILGATTIFKINGANVNRDHEKNGNLIKHLRFMFSQTTKIYMNGLHEITDLNKPNFFSPKWNHPYLQGEVKLYEKVIDTKSGKKEFNYLFKNVKTFNTESLSHNTVINKNSLISLNKIYNVQRLQSITQIKDLFVDMKGKNIEETNLGKLIYTNRFKTQNSNTSKAPIYNGQNCEHARQDYYLSDICRSSICVCRKGNQILNYNSPLNDKPPSYLMIKPNKKTKPIMRTGGGKGTYKLEAGKWFYENKQNIQIEISDEVGDESLFTQHVHKDSTVVSKRGNGTNMLKTHLSQIPHFIRIITMDCLWSKTITEKKIEEVFEKLRRKIHERRAKKIESRRAFFKQLKAEFDLKQAEEKAKEEAQKAKEEAKRNFLSNIREKAKEYQIKANTIRAKAQLEQKAKENKVLEKVVENTTNQLDNSEQKLQEANKVIEELKEEAELREKETVPWNIKEAAFVRDSKGQFFGQCGCCGRKMHPFKPASIHAGHVIPENFITSSNLSNNEKNRIKQALITECNIINICPRCNGEHKCDMREYMKEEFPDRYDTFMKSRKSQFDKLGELADKLGIKEVINKCRSTHV